MSESGQDPSARPFGASIYADLKTPHGKPHALRKLLAEEYSKWEGLEKPGARILGGIDASRLGKPTMVVDNRFSRMSDEEARACIAESMVYLSSHGAFEYSVTLFMGRDGTAQLIRK